MQYIPYVPYRDWAPSPLEGLAEATQSIADAIIKNREKKEAMTDYSLIGDVMSKLAINPGEEGDTDVQPPDMKSLIQEVMPQMKTPAGKAALVKMLMEERPEPMYSSTGEYVGMKPARARILPKDEMALEQMRQEGRQKLEDKKEELRLKIEEMKDERLTRQLTAQDERQLRMFQNQANLLDKRLEKMGGANKPLTTTQTRINAEIDEAREELERKALKPEEILKSTQSTLSTGRENPDYNPAIAKLVNTARRRKYGDDPQFQNYAWAPTLGKGKEGGGEPVTGFKGPGRYRINGKVVAVRSEEEFKQFLGK